MLTNIRSRQRKHDPDCRIGGNHANTEIGIAVSVCHFPPGTSKWNKVEHRLFAYISQNWRGRPLESHEVVVNLIGSTKTKTGLNVRCVLDLNKYEKGIKISDEQMSALNISQNDFCGNWNYTIKPKICS